MCGMNLGLAGPESLGLYRMWHPSSALHSLVQDCALGQGGQRASWALDWEWGRKCREVCEPDPACGLAPCHSFGLMGPDE